MLLVVSELNKIQNSVRPIEKFEVILSTAKIITDLFEQHKFVLYVLFYIQSFHHRLSFHHFIVSSFHRFIVSSFQCRRLLFRLVSFVNEFA